MRWPRFKPGSVALSMMLLPCGLVAAKADPIMHLQNVAFNDGGGVNGFFALNIYGYVSGFSVTSTTGTTLGGQTYISDRVVGTPPASTFTFSTDSNGFVLVLDLASPLGYTSSGFDAIFPGGQARSMLTGSYEECVSNQSVCGVPFGTVRLITSGTVYAAEPTALSILSVAAVLFAATRWHRISRTRIVCDAA